YFRVELGAWFGYSFAFEIRLLAPSVFEEEVQSPPFDDTLHRLNSDQSYLAGRDALPDQIVQGLTVQHRNQQGDRVSKLDSHCRFPSSQNPSIDQIVHYQGIVVNHLNQGRGVHSIFNTAPARGTGKKNKCRSHPLATRSEMVVYGRLKLGGRGLSQCCENYRVYLSTHLDYSGQRVWSHLLTLRR